MAMAATNDIAMRDYKTKGVTIPWGCTVLGLGHAVGHLEGKRKSPRRIRRSLEVQLIPERQRQEVQVVTRLRDQCGDVDKSAFYHCPVRSGGCCQTKSGSQTGYHGRC